MKEVIPSNWLHWRPTLWTGSTLAFITRLARRPSQPLWEAAIAKLERRKDQYLNLKKKLRLAKKARKVPEVVEAGSNSNNIMPQIQAYAAFCILNIK